MKLESGAAGELYNSIARRLYAGTLLDRVG